MYQSQLNRAVFALQVRLVFHGNILTIQIFCRQCLLNLCVFLCVNNSESFRDFLPHEDGFSKVKILILEVHITLFVMVMA